MRVVVIPSSNSDHKPGVCVCVYGDNDQKKNQRKMNIQPSC